MKHRQRQCRSNPTVRDNRRLGFYAAVFDEPTTVYDFRPGAKERTYYREVVRSGAFIDSLDDVMATVDHDPARTFARTGDDTLMLQEDGFGLYASCWLPETALGDQVLADVQAGNLDGASFRFMPVKERWQGNDCELLSVTLADVCLTGKPAYEATRGEVHLRSANRLNELFTRLQFVKFKLRNIHTREVNFKEKNEEKSK